MSLQDLVQTIPLTAISFVADMETIDVCRPGICTLVTDVFVTCRKSSGKRSSKRKMRKMPWRGRVLLDHLVSALLGCAGKHIRG